VSGPKGGKTEYKEGTEAEEGALQGEALICGFF